MPRVDLETWMWQQTRELLVQAERIQQNFFATVGALPSWGPALNLWETERAFVVMAAVPGVAAADIQVEVQDGELVLRGKRALPQSPADGELYLLEIPCGRFERRLRLPRREPLTLGEVRLTQGLLSVELRKQP